MAAYFKGKFVLGLPGKDATINGVNSLELVSGENISISQNDSIMTISSATQVTEVTQEEYNALTEEQKSENTLFMVKSSVADAPALSGMVPPGAIISFLGLHAPLGYLICDGSQYQISKYKNLANYIEEQFGSPSYFGGDGTTTFAVPDMRNLFLRGYHGDAEEQLSGDVGVRQEGTVTQVFTGVKDSVNTYIRTSSITGSDFDTTVRTQTAYDFRGGVTISTSALAAATSRPVNMAVLYCIKT